MFVAFLIQISILFKLCEVYIFSGRMPLPVFHAVTTAGTAHNAFDDKASDLPSNVKQMVE
jgi:hypothetical protein